jgi:hypothetical protein
MDAAALLDERCGRDGEIAWSWHPDVGVKPAVMAMSALRSDTP